MPMRPFKLPADAAVLMDIIPRAFQYPENESWNVQQDEMEGMVDMMRGLRRLWPLLRAIQLLSPPMRDIMRGYVWEEDGQPVGVVNVVRHGASDEWLIGNVAVLPEYRRRGIARRLVTACIDLARQRGAGQVVLDVVVGNTPAYALYQSLGFVQFTGSADYDYDWSAPLPEDCALPDGYRLEALDPFNWRPRYALAGRITPPAIQLFQPVVESRYRQPRLLRPLLPLLIATTGTRNSLSLVRDPDGMPVAIGGYRRRTRSGGTNGIQLILDPAHPDLACPLLTRFLNDLREAGDSLDRRVEFSAGQWQHAVQEAAHALGFRQRYEYHGMGMQLI